MKFKIIYDIDFLLLITFFFMLKITKTLTHRYYKATITNIIFYIYLQIDKIRELGLIQQFF